VSIDLPTALGMKATQPQAAVRNFSQYESMA